MKAIIFLAAMFITVSVNAQSLKDLLYSGKMKTDSGTLVKKGDDLSTKIDTTKKKPVEIEKPKTIAMPGDTSIAGPAIVKDSSVTSMANTVIKSNDKIWKDYVDTLTGSLRTDVIPSKKIKDGTYSILIEYEIGLDGQVTVNSVSCVPESSYLEQQVKERITLGAPQMTPLLNNYGKPRKAIKKYTLVISK